MFVIQSSKVTTKDVNDNKHAPSLDMQQHQVNRDLLYWVPHPQGDPRACMSPVNLLSAKWYVPLGVLIVL